MSMLARSFLNAHAEQVLAGVRELAFHLPAKDGSKMYAMLTEPEDGASEDLGFVIAHSFGLEVLTLKRTERGIARALASVGHSVLFVHRRGFGDSEGDIVDASVDRQMDDLRTAVAWLKAETPARRIGAIGCRLGGLFAGLLGRELTAERLILAQPAISGAQYVKGFLREMQVVRMADPDGTDRRSMDEMLADMRRDGMLDVLGYGLPAALYDGLREVDLSKDMRTFAGDVLLVQVAKRPTLARDYEAFRDTVVAGGGRCATQIIREPAGSTFGSASFVATGHDVNIRADVMEPVVGELGAMAAGWVAS